MTFTKCSLEGGSSQELVMGSLMADGIAEEGKVMLSSSLLEGVHLLALGVR